MRLTQRPPSILVAAAILFAGFMFSSRVLAADTVPGRAEVRGVIGTATYSTNGGPAKPLRVGMILRSGSTRTTGAVSMTS